MKLHYQTGTATFIQLAVVLFLIVLNNVIAYVQDCFVQDTGCVATAFVSMVMIVFAGIWLLILSILGYAAQERRNKRIAYTLIGLEAFTLLIALMLARLPGNWFAGLSAVIAALIAAWVMLLAFRISRAKGGRIVQRQRPRRRLNDTKESIH